MKITWYGHSCFKIESAAGSVVLDPYEDGRVPGLALPALSADAVLCSHAHGDHSAAGKVCLSGNPNGMKVERISTWHDDEEGAKRGANTVSVIEADGVRVAHMGDLGHELSESQLKSLGRIDVLLIPVGGYYTIDTVTARRVVDAVAPKIVIPMHYRGDGFGFSEIAPVDDFAALSSPVEYREECSYEPSALDEGKTIILKLVN